MIENVTHVCESLSVNAKAEYRTPLGSRIDIALFKENKPALAIEFENSYKWIAQRVLYNGIKAHAAGFDTILFICPFQKEFTNKLVLAHLEHLGVRVYFSDKNTYQDAIFSIVKDI